MNRKYLKKLCKATQKLLAEENIEKIISNLKIKIDKSKEPFIWHIVDIKNFQGLPLNIKSAWIFVLKPNVSSHLHYHPNSVQHTTVIEGKGKIRIGNSYQNLRLFDANDETTWYIINKNVPHEFFPMKKTVIISFHTCLSHELIEIRCESGEKRIYELQMRIATFDDARAIHEIIAEAFEPYKKYYTKEAYNATVVSIAKIEKRLRKREVLVATHDNKIVGTASIRIEGKNIHISSMAVKPDYQGKGVGLQILREINELAIRKKCKTISLECFYPLRKAIKLYEKFGFKKTGKIRNYYGIKIFGMLKEIYEKDG